MNRILYAVWLLLSLEARGLDWPQWRGADRSNVSAESGLLREWPTNGPPLLWKASGLGEGIASVSTSGGKVFTLGYRDESEYLFCLDAVSGEGIWSARIGPVIGENRNMRWFTQRAPTVDGERVFALGGAGNLVCAAVADGKILWRKSYQDDFKSLWRPWGFADWPMVDGEKLLCAPMAPLVTFAALHKGSGEIIWTNHIPAENFNIAYVPLVPAVFHGVKQYVGLPGSALVGIDPENGKILWRQTRTVRTGSIYTPLIKDDLIFSACGYGGGKSLFKVSRTDGQFEAKVVFDVRSNFFEGFQDNTVLIGEHVFSFENPGTPVCLELKSGDVVWRAERRTGRTAVTAADGHLYARRANGMISLIEANPALFREKSSFVLPNLEEGQGVTAPVVSNGRLYVRDNNRLLCYAISPATVANAPSQPKATSLTVKEVAPGNPNLAAAYVPTPPDIVTAMLKLAQLKAGEELYDLGSGDGRIVIAAAKDFGARATGYEIDYFLTAKAQREATELKVKGMKFERQDMFLVDLSAVDVAAVYLPEEWLAKLVPQFKKMKAGARIVSHQFAIPGFRATREETRKSEEDGDTHRIYLYEIPLKIDLRK